MASWLPFLSIVALKKGINCKVLHEWKEVNKNKMAKVQELLLLTISTSDTELISCSVLLQDPKIAESLERVASLPRSQEDN